MQLAIFHFRLVMFQLPLGKCSQLHIQYIYIFSHPPFKATSKKREKLSESKVNAVVLGLK